MSKKLWKRIVSALLLVSFIIALCACTKDPTIDGGIVDRTDPDAPKEIVSKTITDFAAAFYLKDRRSAVGKGTFRFEVKPDKSGELFASESVSGASMKTDRELMNAIQAIIDENGLAEKNGVCRYTAGLDPDEHLCELTANYASGEKLHFRINNDETAKWAEQLFDLFADRFSAAGVDLLCAQEIGSPIVDFRISMTKNGVRTDCGTMNVSKEEAIDGETQLIRRLVTDPSTSTVTSKDFAKIPADYNERLTAVFAAFGVRDKFDQSTAYHNDGYFGFGPRPENEEDGENSMLLVVTFEDGTRLFISTAKPSELEGADAFLSALYDYFDSLIG